jgi:DNA repair protein RAD57
MTNLLTVLPDFDTTPFTHILPSLERALISAADLLTLDALDVAKRAQVPPGEVKKLSEALLDRLHASLRDANGRDLSVTDDKLFNGVRNGLALVDEWSCISTLDDSIDGAIGRGIAPGYLTELVGER